MQALTAIVPLFSQRRTQHCSSLKKEHNGSYEQKSEKQLSANRDNNLSPFPIGN